MQEDTGIPRRANAVQSAALFGAPPAHAFSEPFSLPRAQGVELTVDKIETVLSPEQIALDDKSRRAEDAELFGLGRELAIELLHRLAGLGRDQLRPIIAVLLRNRLAHLGSRDIALFGPQGAQDGVR